MTPSEPKPASPVIKELHRSLSTILYELDPEGMGSRAGSPRDEYDDIAWRLVVGLRDKSPGEATVAAVTRTLPGLDGVTASALAKVWDDAHGMTQIDFA